MLTEQSSKDVFGTLERLGGFKQVILYPSALKFYQQHPECFSDLMALALLFSTGGQAGVVMVGIGGRPWVDIFGGSNFNWLGSMSVADVLDRQPFRFDS